MEKKLMAIVFLIGMILLHIVKVIVYFLPFIITGVLLYFIIKGYNAAYNDDADGVAFIGSHAITPLLIIGWLYFIFVYMIYPTYWTTFLYWGII